MGTSKFFTERNSLLSLESLPLQWEPYRCRSLLFPAPDAKEPSSQPEATSISMPGCWLSNRPFLQEKSPLQPHSGLHPERSQQGIKNLYSALLKVWGVHYAGRGIYTKVSLAYVQSPFSSLRERDQAWPNCPPGRILQPWSPVNKCLGKETHISQEQIKSF